MHAQCLDPSPVPDRSQRSAPPLPRKDRNASRCRSAGGGLMERETLPITDNVISEDDFHQWHCQPDAASARVQTRSITCVGRDGTLA